MIDLDRRIMLRPIPNHLQLAGIQTHAQAGTFVGPELAVMEVVSLRQIRPGLAAGAAQQGAPRLG